MLLNAGLPLRLENNRLVFSGIPQVRPDFRLAKDLKDVASFSLPDNEILYAMYRGISRAEHKALFEKFSLRYDITIILPKILGTEFPKTAGHYHSLSKKVSYPEVYEVLYGKAHFLLQKGKGRVSDAVMVAAQSGDVVVVPPDYGHITINPSREVLVLGNLISVNVKPDYKNITKFKGGAYFETVKGIIKNPKVRSARLRPLDAGRLGSLGIKSPLYYEFTKNPEKFLFLGGPEKFMKELGRVLPKK